MQSQLIPDDWKRCNLKTLLRSSKSPRTWFMWAASERGWSGLGFGCWAGSQGQSPVLALPVETLSKLFDLSYFELYLIHFDFPITRAEKISPYQGGGRRLGVPSRGGEGVERWSGPALALPVRRRLCQPQLFGTDRHSHLQVQRRVRVATGHW